MASQRIVEVMERLVECLTDKAEGPNRIQEKLLADGYALAEIQQAFQLALSRGLVETDERLHVRRAA